MIRSATRPMRQSVDPTLMPYPYHRSPYLPRDAHARSIVTIKHSFRNMYYLLVKLVVNFRAFLGGFHRGNNPSNAGLKGGKFLKGNNPCFCAVFLLFEGNVAKGRGSVLSIQSYQGVVADCLQILKHYYKRACGNADAEKRRNRFGKLEREKRSWAACSVNCYTAEGMLSDCIWRPRRLLPQSREKDEGLPKGGRRIRASINW